MNHPHPRITLVGAGPGASDLITLRGLQALRRADVVLYDALVHPALLEEVPAHALRIAVGKRAGRPSCQQQDIHSLMVRYARSHGHVVRLKGGDPFVFGRGAEEVAFAKKHGIAVEVVPGLSSSTAVPALAGVPVTCRGVARCFTVLTATSADGKLNEELVSAARSDATVVILMGLRKLEAIADVWCRAGRGQLPAMVVQSGSLPDERILTGTIEALPARLRQAPHPGPGLIVIGEVVRLSPHWVEALAGPICRKAESKLSVGHPAAE